VAITGGALRSESAASLLDNGLTGSYSGLEVRLWEITVAPMVSFTIADLS